MTCHKSELGVLDDGPEKPARIWSRIGRRPLIAGGNSNGDIAMMHFATSRSKRSCGCSCCMTMLNGSSTTPAVRSALARAADQGWTVVSIKNDWSRVFADI